MIIRPTSSLAQDRESSSAETSFLPTLLTNSGPAVQHAYIPPPYSQPVLGQLALSQMPAGIFPIYKSRRNYFRRGGNVCTAAERDGGDRGRGRRIHVRTVQAGRDGQVAQERSGVVGQRPRQLRDGRNEEDAEDPQVCPRRRRDLPVSDCQQWSIQSGTTHCHWYAVIIVTVIFILFAF